MKKPTDKKSASKVKISEVKVSPIEKALMDAYNSEEINIDDMKIENGEIKSTKKSLKIPGVRKEDGSDCCGGGCCFDKEKKVDQVWTKKQYLDLINMVVDPETAVGITDMGLIYDVEEMADGLVQVTMTLTSLGCPAGGQITTEIDSLLRIQPHVKDVKIEVVWEPSWNPGMMNPEVKAMLFGN